jgi:NAD(P)-dependent dehydrogenase (short-subunit alcohol dehydrogenase family)
LSDFSLGQNAVDIAISAFGKVDGLIINHGILGEVARIADCDPAGFRKTFDVNFFSAVACVSSIGHGEICRYSL